MRCTRSTNSQILATMCLCALAMGCGTTKWSDSPRTATEQLLVSDAIDRSVSEIDFSVLAQRDVYLDTRYITTALDQNYLVSTLRQHMLASGCIIHDKPEDAEFVVEVRSGALGTNRQDVLVGIPATNLPTAGMLPIGAAAIPEIAISKRTNQQAVCKIAVFAYERMSGQPVWQSGNRKISSRAMDSWFLGAGPFQKGTIYERMSFAGEHMTFPFMRKSPPPKQASVSTERNFVTDGTQVAQPTAQPPHIASLPPTDQAPLSRPPAGAPPTAQAAPPAAAPPEPPPTDQSSAPHGKNRTDDEARKAAYTPPPNSSVPPATQPTPGLQGHLSAQSIQTPVNPAAVTAGAIQTFNLAKELLAGSE